MNIATSKFYPIPGYEENYQINRLGVVQSLDRYVTVNNYKRLYKQKTITPNINNRGYVSLKLHKSGKTKTHFIHVLLAQCFIPNPEYKPEINHKNGIKTDNNLENLEWCTHQENMRHAYHMGLIDITKKCLPVINLRTGVIFKKGVKEAAEHFSLSTSTCKNYLNGNRHNPTPLRYHNTNTLIQSQIIILTWFAPAYIQANTLQEKIAVIDSSRKMYNSFLKFYPSSPKRLP